MNDLPFLPMPEPMPGARIKVVGVGGAGCNAVNRMIESGVTGVEFIAMNTDQQSLSLSKASINITLGPSSMRGLGAGGNANRGYVAAEESRDGILKALEGADMIFITAGMGGGTGTGAAPVIANYAKELNTLTVAVVLTPFEWEGQAKIEKAHGGLSKLKEVADTVITVSNARLQSLCPEQATQKEVLRTADSVLIQGVRGIADLILNPGDLNGDFADVESVLRNGGEALIGTGVGSGPDAILDALKLALACPLLERSENGGATKVIVSMMANYENHPFIKVQDAMKYLQSHYAGGSEVKLCQVESQTMHDEVHITILASGFSESLEDTPVYGRNPKVTQSLSDPEPSAFASARNTMPLIPLASAPSSIYGQTGDLTGDLSPTSMRIPERLTQPNILAPTSSGEVHGGEAQLEIPTILRNRQGQLPLE